MKRSKFSVFAILILLVHTGLMLAQSGMTIQAGVVTAAPGAVVTMPIELVGATNIGGAHVEVLYDPDILRVSRVTNKTTGLVQEDMSQSGRIIIGLVTTDALEGNVEIVDVVFDVIGDQGEQSGIFLENVSVIDATTLQEQPLATINGSVEIITAETGGSNVGLWAMFIIIAVVLIGLVLFLFTRRTAVSSNVSLNTISGSAIPSSITMTKNLIVLGRDQGCDIIINDDMASRHHAQISRQGEVYQIVDMDSTNGTRVDGANIRSCQLSSGSIIEIGDTRIQFVKQ